MVIANWGGAKRRIGRYGASLTLVFLVGLNCLITRNFVSVNTLWNIVIQSSTVMMVALGMTVVIASGGVDISVGATMALSSMVAAIFISRENIFLGVSTALAASVAAGLVSGLVVARFNVQPMIATLAMQYLVRGVAQILNDGRILSFKNEAFTGLAYYRIAGIPVQLFLVAFVALIIYVLIKKTPFGTCVEAYGDNKKAARMSGIHTDAVLLGAFTLCSVLASLSGILETARIEACDPSKIGRMIELDAIAATAIGNTPMNGGSANIAGTIQGVLIMQVITTMVNMNNIPFSSALIIKTLFLIAAMYLQKLSRR